LSTAHRQLQAVVGDQLVELSASRRRLVTAADEERRRLDDRLRSGAERCLRELDELLERASVGATPALARVQRATSLLAQTVEDLHQLAGGLHPRELSFGLARALESMKSRSPLPIDLTVECVDVSDEITTAIYYVCAEALANTIKHAQATSMAIRVTSTPRLLRVVVTDDGRGGARIDQGSGLRGLTDRVEALGGTLRVDTPPARGTRLTVEFVDPVASRNRGHAETRTGHDADEHHILQPSTSSNPEEESR
jgi:signal transduction histidine kinase